MNLQNKIAQSNGTEVKNYNGALNGKIVETIYQARKKGSTYKTKYIIIRSGDFSGDADRYFAIPVTSSFLTVTAAGDIILKLDKEDLKFVRSIWYDEDSKLVPNLDGSIYELYDYNE